MENKKIFCAIFIIALLTIPGVNALTVPGTDTRSLTDGDYYRYEITLSQNQKIRVTLDVPSGADFDLYAYAPDNTEWKSVSTVLGQDESLDITAPQAGTYEIYVDAYSGSGTYTLIVENLSGLDSTTIAIIAAVVIIVVVLIIVFLLMRQRKGKAPAPTYGAAPPPPSPYMTQTQPSQPITAPQTPAPPPTATCPSCGGPLTWIPEYKRWYCYKENKYA